MRPAEKVGTSLADAARAAGAGDGVLRGFAAAPMTARLRVSPLSATARTRCRCGSRCVPVALRDALRCLAKRARDDPGSGLRPGVLMTISDRWSGIRTRDTWITSPLLYPSELSRGQRAGLEPATDSTRGCCSTFEPTLSQAARCGIGIRHGKAARTGRDTSPYRCCRSRVRLRTDASFEGRFLALYRGRRGVAMHACVVEVLCERRNENAPGMESEGIRRASEDRGDRSPVEETVSSGQRLHTRTTRAGPHRAWAAMAWCGWL